MASYKAGYYLYGCAFVRHRGKRGEKGQSNLCSACMFVSDIDLHSQKLWSGAVNKSQNVSWPHSLFVGEKAVTGKPQRSEKNVLGGHFARCVLEVEFCKNYAFALHMNTHTVTRNGGKPLICVGWKGQSCNFLDASVVKTLLKKIWQVSNVRLVGSWLGAARGSCRGACVTRVDNKSPAPASQSRGGILPLSSQHSCRALPICFNGSKTTRRKVKCTPFRMEELNRGPDFILDVL